MANDRFMRKGITKVYFVETITNEAAASAAEITAGTDVSPQVAEMNGFTFENNPINTPNLDNAFVGQISGEDTVAASSLTLYELSDTTVIRDALAKGTQGYIVIFPIGLATPGTVAAGDTYESWAVDISSNSRRYSAGNEAAQYMVNFAPNSPPVSGTVA